MIPILYEKNETAFTTNGLGRLRDCISCKVSEERNSIYECEFEYPVNGANFDKIQLGRIIGVEHDDTSDVQPFDIVSYSKPINGVVTFHAVHISYRQSKIVASGSNVAGLSETFAMLKSGLPENPFTYWTDKESTTQFPLGDGVPRSVREMLGGTEGSVLDTYGGEFEWDKFNVKLWEHRGSPTDFCIRYGVNMTEYEDETDSSESYSAIVPYWIGQDGDTQTVIKGGMISSGTTVSGRVDCVAIDYSQEFQNVQPTAAELEEKARQTLSSKNPQLATQTIKVGFIRLQDSGEYNELGNLLKCKLCDTVQVIFPRYKMSGRFKIVKTEYDVLAERFTAMELGTLSTTLSEALGIGSGGGGTTYSTSGGGGETGADYVTEQSTSGIWTYRKWNSGLAECWGTTATRTVTSWSAWGGLYYGNPYNVRDSYPSGLFISAPNCQAQIGTNDGDMFLVKGSGSGTEGTATYTPAFYPARGSSGSVGVTYTVSYYAVGKWK